MPATGNRIVIRSLADGSDIGSFADDVRQGLTSTPRSIPPKYFYDDLGSQLFIAICRLPEYYLTRAESEILRHHADEIVASFGWPVRILELGSGSAEKTRYLIEAALSRQGTLHYVPVDISPVSLEQSGAELLRAYPDLSITGYAADYFTALTAMAETGVPGPGDTRTMALFLGSNIGNFNQDETLAFLRAVRQVLRRGDALLVGADLKKSPDVLVAAYDDALGVTAAFNLNLLARMNRELDGNFDVKKFAHRAVWNESQGRMEMYLLSRVDQSVRLGALDLDVQLAEGESIHTENSYKFDLDQLSDYARSSGFTLARTWFDSQHLFSFNLFAVS
jgi:dimethylhistidine N-methyltransferase